MLEFEDRRVDKAAGARQNGCSVFSLIATHSEALHGAQVAELADALDSGSSGRKVVEVRVLSRAPITSSILLPRVFGFSFERISFANKFVESSLLCGRLRSEGYERPQMPANQENGSDNEVGVR